MTTEPRDRKIGVGEKGSRALGIGVVGVGGGGSNIVSYLCKQGIDDVDFYAINTDKQALDRLDGDLEAIQIGSRICDGEGAGGDPEIGRSAAQEDTQLLMSQFNVKRLLFIISCMGGGTGTGASPIIAGHATHENNGLLTVAILTTPDGGGGDQTVKLAEQGIQAVRDQVDAMMVIPNNKPGVGMRKRHREINQLIFEKINAITRLLVDTQVPNIDMADLKATLAKINGRAVDMFIGTASMTMDEAQQPAQHEQGDSQARFKELLNRALDTNWLVIDFSKPIEEGRGLLSFTLGGDEDDEDIDDITDESSIKHAVEEMQSGAEKTNLKIASFVDPNEPKGTMNATVVLRASNQAKDVQSAADRRTPIEISDSQTDSGFDPSTLPTNKQITDINEGAEDFESDIGPLDEALGATSLDFTENAEATTELTRKNPS